MNKTDNDNTLKDILETTKNIFLTLINNPDYQGTKHKSREDVVLQESLQRAKQNYRNKMALSMIQNSHMDRFSDFMFKAEGDPTDAELAREEEANRLLWDEEEANRLLGESAIDVRQEQEQQDEDELIEGLPKRTLDLPQYDKSAWQDWGQPVEREADFGNIEEIRSESPYEVDPDYEYNEGPYDSDFENRFNAGKDLADRSDDPSVRRREKGIGNELEGFEMPNLSDFSTLPDIKEPDPQSGREFELNPLSAIRNILGRHTSGRYTQNSPLTDLQPYVNDMLSLTDPASMQLARRAVAGRLATYADSDGWKSAKPVSTGQRVDPETGEILEASQIYTPMELSTWQRFNNDDIELGRQIGQHVLPGTSYNNAFRAAIEKIQTAVLSLDKHINAEAKLRDNEGNWKNVWQKIQLPEGINVTNNHSQTFNALSQRRSQLAQEAQTLTIETLSTLMPSISSYNPDTKKAIPKNFMSLLSQDMTPEGKTSEQLERLQVIPEVDASILTTYRKANPQQAMNIAENNATTTDKNKLFKNLLKGIEETYGAFVPSEDNVPYQQVIQEINRQINTGSDFDKKRKMDAYESHLQKLQEVREGDIGGENLSRYKNYTPEQQSEIWNHYQAHRGAGRGIILDKGANSRWNDVQKQVQQIRAKNAAVEAYAVSQQLLADGEAADKTRVIRTTDRQIIGLHEKNPGYAQWRKAEDNYQEKLRLAGLSPDALSDPDDLEAIVRGNENDMASISLDRKREEDLAKEDTPDLNVADDEEDFYTQNPDSFAPTPEQQQGILDQIEGDDTSRRASIVTADEIFGQIMDMYDNQVSQSSSGTLSRSPDQHTHRVKRFRQVQEQMADPRDANLLQSLADRLHAVNGVTGVSLRGEIAKHLMGDTDAFKAYGTEELAPIQMNIAHKEGADKATIQKLLDEFKSGYAAVSPNGALRRAIEPNFISNTGNEYGVPMRVSPRTTQSNRGHIDKRIDSNSLVVAISGDPYYARWAHSHITKNPRMPAHFKTGLQKAQEKGFWGGGLYQRSKNIASDPFIVSDAAVTQLLDGGTEWKLKAGEKWDHYRDPLKDANGHISSDNIWDSPDVQRVETFINSLPKNATVVDNGVSGANAIGAYFAAKRGLQVISYPIKSNTIDQSPKQNAEHINNQAKPHILARFGREDGLLSPHFDAMQTALRGAHEINGREESEYPTDAMAQTLLGEQVLDEFGNPPVIDQEDQNQVVFQNRDIGRQLPMIGNYDPAGYRKSAVHPSMIPLLEDNDMQLAVADGNKLIEKFGLSAVRGRIMGKDTQRTDKEYNRGLALPKNIIAQSHHAIGKLTDAEVREASKHHPLIAGMPESYNPRYKDSGEPAKAMSGRRNQTFTLGDDMFHTSTEFNAGQDQSLPSLVSTIFDRIDSSIGKKTVEPFTTKGWTEGRDRDRELALRFIHELMELVATDSITVRQHSVIDPEELKQEEYYVADPVKEITTRQDSKRQGADPSLPWWDTTLSDGSSIVNSIRYIEDDEAKGHKAGTPIPTMYDVRRNANEMANTLVSKQGIEVRQGDTVMLSPDGIGGHDWVVVPPDQNLGMVRRQTTDLDGNVTEWDDVIQPPDENGPSNRELFISKLSYDPKATLKYMASVKPEFRDVLSNFDNLQISTRTPGESFTTPALTPIFTSEAEEGQKASRIDVGLPSSSFRSYGSTYNAGTLRGLDAAAYMVRNKGDSKGNFPSIITYENSQDTHTEVHSDDWQSMDENKNPIVKKITELLGYSSPMQMLKDLSFNPSEKSLDRGFTEALSLKKSLTKEQVDEIKNDPILADKLMPFIKQQGGRRDPNVKIKNEEGWKNMQQGPYIFEPKFTIPSAEALRGHKLKAQKVVASNHIAPMEFNDNCSWQMDLVDSNGHLWHMGSFVPEWSQLIEAQHGTRAELENITYRFVQSQDGGQGRPDLMHESGRTPIRGITKVVKNMMDGNTFAEITGLEDLVNLDVLDETQLAIRQALRESTPEHAQRLMSALHQASINPPAHMEGQRDRVKMVLDKGPQRLPSQRAYSAYDITSHSHSKERNRFSESLPNFRDEHYAQMINYAASLVNDKYQPPETYNYGVQYPSMPYEDNQGQILDGPMLDPRMAQNVLSVIAKEFNRENNYITMRPEEVYRGHLLASGDDPDVSERTLVTDTKNHMALLFPEGGLEPYTWNEFVNEIDHVSSRLGFSDSMKDMIRPSVIRQTLDEHNEFMKNMIIAGATDDPEAVEANRSAMEARFKQDPMEEWSPSQEFLTTSKTTGLPVYNADNESMAQFFPHRGKIDGKYQLATQELRQAQARGSKQIGKLTVLDSFSRTGTQGLNARLHTAITRALEQDDELTPLSPQDALLWEKRGIRDMSPDKFITLDSNGLLDTNAMTTQRLLSVANIQNAFYTKMPQLMRIADRLGYDTVHNMFVGEGLYTPHLTHSYDKVNGQWSIDNNENIGYQPIASSELNNLGRKISFWGEIDPALLATLRGYSFNDTERQYLQQLPSDKAFNESAKMGHYNSLRDGILRVQKAMPQTYAQMGSSPFTSAEFMENIGGQDNLNLQEAHAIQRLFQLQEEGGLEEPLNYATITAEDREILAPLFQAGSTNKIHSALMSLTQRGTDILNSNLENDLLGDPEEHVTANASMPMVQVLHADDQGNIIIQGSVVSFGPTKTGGYQLRGKYSSHNVLRQGESIHSNELGAESRVSQSARSPINLSKAFQVLNQDLQMMQGGAPFQFETTGQKSQFENPDGSVHAWVGDVKSKLNWLKTNYASHIDDSVGFGKSPHGRTFHYIINDLLHNLGKLSYPTAEGFSVPGTMQTGGRGRVQPGTGVKINWSTDDEGNHAPHIQANEIVKLFHQPASTFNKGFQPVNTVEEYLDAAFDLFDRVLQYGGEVNVPNIRVDEDGNTHFIQEEPALMKDPDALAQKNYNLLSVYSDYIRDLQGVAERRLSPHVGPNSYAARRAWENEAMKLVNQLGKHILPQSHMPEIKEHLANEFVIGGSSSPDKFGDSRDINAPIEGIDSERKYREGRWEQTSDVTRPPSAEERERREKIIAWREEHDLPVDYESLDSPIQMTTSRYAFDPDGKIVDTWEEKITVTDQEGNEREVRLSRFWATAPAEGEYWDLGRTGILRDKTRNGGQPLINLDGTIHETADQDSAGILPINARNVVQGGVNWDNTRIGANNRREPDPLLLSLSDLNAIPVNMPPAVYPTGPGQADIYRRGKKIASVKDNVLSNRRGEKVAELLSRVHLAEALAGRPAYIRKDDGTTDVVNLSPTDNGFLSTPIAQTIDNTPEMVFSIPQQLREYLSQPDANNQRHIMVAPNLYRNAIAQSWPVELVEDHYQMHKDRGGDDGISRGIMISGGDFDAQQMQNADPAVMVNRIISEAPKQFNTLLKAIGEAETYSDTSNQLVIDLFERDIAKKLGIAWPEEGEIPPLFRLALDQAATTERINEVMNKVVAESNPQNETLRKIRVGSIEVQPAALQKNIEEWRRIQYLLTEGKELGVEEKDPLYEHLGWLGKYLYSTQGPITENFLELNDMMASNGLTSLFNNKGKLLWNPTSNIEGDSHDPDDLTRIYGGAREWTNNLFQLARGLNIEGREDDVTLPAAFAKFWEDKELLKPFEQGAANVQVTHADTSIPLVNANLQSNGYNNSSSFHGNIDDLLSDVHLNALNNFVNSPHKMVQPWKLSEGAMNYLKDENMGFNIDETFKPLMKAEGEKWETRLFAFVPNGIDPASVGVTDISDPRSWQRVAQDELGMNPDFAGVNAFTNPIQWQLLMSMFSPDGEFRHAGNEEGGFEDIPLKHGNVVGDHIVAGKDGHLTSNAGLNWNEKHPIMEAYTGAISRKITTDNITSLIPRLQEENLEFATYKEEVPLTEDFTPEWYKKDNPAESYGEKVIRRPWYATEEEKIEEFENVTGDLEGPALQAAQEEVQKRREALPITSKDNVVDPKAKGAKDMVTPQVFSHLESQPANPDNVQRIPGVDKKPWLGYSPEDGKFWNVNTDAKGNFDSFGSELDIDKDMADRFKALFATDINPNQASEALNQLNADPEVQELQMKTKISNLPSQLQDIWHIMAQEHGEGDILTAMQQVQGSGSHVRGSAKHRFDQLQSMSKANLEKVMAHMDDAAEDAGVEEAPRQGLDDLKSKAQQMHRKLVSSPNNPGGWALPDSYFDGKNEGEVQKIIADMQDDMREKEIAIREQATYTKANNIGHLQMAPGATPEMVQQLGRQLMLHQINYTHKDRKGKDYMTDESKAQLRGAWDAVEQSGMLDMDSLMSELGSVTRGAEQQGWPSDPNDTEKIVNPWEDHVNRIEQHMRDEQMNREDLVANLAAQGMDHVNNPNSGAGRFTVRGQASDMQGNPMAETPYQNDLVAPTILGLSPQTQSAWQEYHQQKLRTRGMEFEDIPIDVRASLSRNLDYLKSAGFQDEWFAQAGKTQQELNGVEYGPNGYPLDAEGQEEIPPQIYNPNTREVETAQVFHEGTRAWINPYILGEHMKGVEDHVFVPHFGLIRQRADKIPQELNVEQTNPILQGIIPSSTSTLAQDTNIVVGPSGIQRVYRDDYPSQEKGPLSPTDAAAYALGTQIETDIEQNQENYQHGFVPLSLPQPDSPEQVPTSQPIDTLANTGIVEQQSNPVDMPAPEGGSAVAQFLARVRKVPPTGRETVADQLQAGARDFLNNLGGLWNINAGGLIPADSRIPCPSCSRRTTEN